VDGFDEVPSGGLHGEVDGVEVLFATETATQVGLRVDGRLGFVATRADELEPAFAAFNGPLKVLSDGPLQGNLVPQAKHQLTREVLGHGKDLSKVGDGGQAAGSGKLEFA
jgi:hypothetical protein